MDVNVINKVRVTTSVARTFFIAVEVWVKCRRANCMIVCAAHFCIAAIDLTEKNNHVGGRLSFGNILLFSYAFA